MGSCEITVVEKRCVKNTEKKYVRCGHFVFLDKIDCFMLLLRSQMQYIKAIVYCHMKKMCSPAHILIHRPNCISKLTPASDI